MPILSSPLRLRLVNFSLSLAVTFGIRAKASSASPRKFLSSTEWLCFFLPSVARSPLVSLNSLDEQVGVRTSELLFAVAGKERIPNDECNSTMLASVFWEPACDNNELVITTSSPACGDPDAQSLFPLSLTSLRGATVATAVTAENVEAPSWARSAAGTAQDVMRPILRNCRL